MSPTQTPLLPETTIPALSQTRLDAMIDHALTHPRASPPAATNPASRLSTFPRVAIGGGAMALAASLALAVVLFHQPQQQAHMASTGATASDAMPEISDYLIYTSLEQSAS